MRHAGVCAVPRAWVGRKGFGRMSRVGVREDVELLGWLETLRRFNPERFAELRAAIAACARSEEATARAFSEIACMLSNLAELPSAAPAA